MKLLVPYAIRDRSGPDRPVHIATLLAFPLARKGGISTFVAGLVPALERTFAVDVRLLAPPRTEARAGDRWSQVALVLKQCAQLLAYRPDIVHTHEHPANLAAAVIYRLISGHTVRVVHTFHIEPAERRSWWKRVLLGWLLARCWAITAVSAHTAARLGHVALPAPSTVHVIQGAAELPVRAPDDAAVVAFRRRYALGAGPILCQVGLNFRLKVAGAMQLIRALPRLRARFPDARLLLVGGGRFRTQVETACREAGVTDAVVLTGFIDDISLPLAASDLYCHITFQDACPLSLLEAMRCGKPIVAARSGGIPEIISSGVEGILVEPEAEEIARTILHLLTHPEEARLLGAAAQVRASEHFTWQRVAEDFGSLFGLRRRAVR